MLMSDIESMKATFEQQARDIVQETRNELNEKNVGGGFTQSWVSSDK